MSSVVERHAQCCAVVRPHVHSGRPQPVVVALADRVPNPVIVEGCLLASRTTQPKTGSEIMTTNNTTTTNNIATTFPWEAVYARLSMHLDSDIASEAVLAAHHYWESNRAKCTVESLCWVGVRRHRQSEKRVSRVSADSETAEALAVAPQSAEPSHELADLLSGLSGRELAIAQAWSTGLKDTEVADLVGCSVRTVERTRVSLASRIGRQLA